MTGRLRRLEYDQMDQLIRKLVAAGMSAEDAIDVMINDGLAHDWVEWLHKERAGLNLFASTLAVWEALCRRRDVRKWPLTNEQLNALMPTASAPRSRLTNVLVPKIWLGNLDYTLDELEYWMIDVHSELKMSPYLYLRSDRVRLASPDNRNKRPWVQWVSINMLGASTSGVNSTEWPAFAMLAAIAVHPKWAQAVGTDGVPRVLLPAFKPRSSTEGAWDQTPVLLGPSPDHGASVYLAVDYDDEDDNRYVSPVSREL